MHEYNYDNFDDIKHFIDPNVLDTTEMKLTRINNNDFAFHNEEYTEDGYIYTPKWEFLESDNGGIPFTYRANRSGFRSQHFENFDPADKNIHIAGCSNSLGIGLPEDLVWGSILTNKIKEKFPDENVQKYNVSVGGASIPFIFKNVMSFLRKNDGVDYLFILLPGFDRHIAFDDENRPLMFKKIVFMSPESEGFKLKCVKRFVLNYSAEEAFFTQLPMIKAIEDICKAKNIKLVWSTWKLTDQKLYNSYEFDNYVHISKDILNYDLDSKDDYEYKNLARDNMHPGLNFMSSVADVFYGELSAN
jgi:hypothetical protein